MYSELITINYSNIGGFSKKHNLSNDEVIDLICQIIEDTDNLLKDATKNNSDII